jgi:hypothetical protein
VTFQGLTRDRLVSATTINGREADEAWASMVSTVRLIEELVRWERKE